MRNSFLIAVAIMTVVSSVQAKIVSSLPPNVHVPDVLAGVVAQVYERSDTFRAQCDRLTQATNLRVNVNLDVYIPHSCRAFTVISRKAGLLCADVHVPAGSNEFAELIAHEFEHILEQVEHLNLRKLAKVRGSGVHEIAFDLFETDRAQHTGKIVANEVRLRHERPSAD